MRQQQGPGMHTMIPGPCCCRTIITTPAATASREWWVSKRAGEKMETLALRPMKATQKVTNLLSGEGVYLSVSQDT